MKKRVAVVLHGLGANGIDTLFANLARKWDYTKVEVTYFLAVDKGAAQFWENEVVSNGVRVIHLHDLDKNRLFKWPLTLRKALKDYGPFDAVHMNMDMLNGINLIVAKNVGIPIRICHAHRSSSENADSKAKKIYIFALRKLMNRYATDRIACSEKAGEYFFPGAAFQTIYNGIDVEKYHRENTNMHASNRFVSVGRFTPQKNPFFLLEVFTEVAKRLPDATLKWIGDGPLLDGVKQKADETGISTKTDFLGIRRDVDALLKESDYFLLPSVFEGLSLALAEAQAAGLDCFVSNTVSQMSDCGKCKFIQLSAPAEKWADEIVAYINGNSKMEIDNDLLSRFDIGQMARKMEAIYCR